VDLTRRKEIEKAHLQAVEFTEDLINSLPAIFFMFRISGNDAKLVKWNKNYEVKVGYSPDDLIEKSAFDFFDKEDKKNIAESIALLFENEELDNEANLIYADGSKHPYYFKAKSFTIDGIKFFFGIGIDISQQKNAEQAVKDSEEKYRKLYQNANDSIFIMDDDVFIDCNDETLEMFDCKREEIIGSTPYNFSPLFQPDGTPSKEKATELINSALNKEIKVFEWLHATAKNRLFYAEVSLSSVNLKGKKYLQAIVRDINERKIAEIELEKYKNRLEELVKNRTDELQAANEALKLTNEKLQMVNKQITDQKEELNSTLEELKNAQSQLIQSEKMASLGLLTSGVSHEINNPLNYIQAGIYGLENIAKENKIDYESFRTVLNHMQEGVNRVSKIVKSLNSFSKLSEKKKENCDIHKILNNCILVLKHKLEGKCEIEKNYVKTELHIVANEGELHHVFTNILQNAILAIEQKGKITIKTDVADSGRLAQITIQDTGKGISKENISKIYDPFFTTMAPGKGTGLGLSIALRIIKEYQGTIKYSSEIGKGTKVLITLPIKE
jgi:PAS domain S-box-containing protein